MQHYEKKRIYPTTHIILEGEHILAEKASIHLPSPAPQKRGERGPPRPKIMVKESKR